MKILLTGICGYVGTSLAASLLEAGHEVVGFDIQWFGNYVRPHPRLTIIKGDIRDVESIPWNGIESVLHLANVANDPCSELNSKLNWEVNTLASMLLIEKAISAGVRQFVFASSGSVYGVKDEPEVTEELSLVPISDYNKTKMISERVFLSYADRILVNIVRPATICGFSPRMRLDLSVNMLTMQALTHGKITVFGGDQTRPNIHLKDMIRVYMHLLEKGKSMPGIYNAGFENISILDIARRITSKVPAEIIVSESNDPRSYRLSSKKLLQSGFAPHFGVDDAIDDLIAAHKTGGLRMEDRWFNIKTMKTLPNLA
ncbi:MAG: SDR family NAD-dependent epimerase/dehydratase [Proteobacteria bacterium]|nr:SDR family NAD-dependent epimerase/dehydratase [Pseudomonadota bacterium]